MLSIGTAHAFPQQHLKEARDALKNGERRATRIALDEAEAAFGSTDSVVLNDVLARYWFYRGLLAAKRGKESLVMDSFRQALVVDRTFVWDRDLSEDLELRKVFEALRGEVEGRDQRPTGVPERTGCAVAYVDGTRVSGGSEASIGVRLAQVQCPKGDVYSRWIDFSDEEQQLDWLSLCPYAVDTSIEANVATASEDEFGGIGPSFGPAETVDEGPCSVEALSEPAPPESSADEGSVASGEAVSSEGDSTAPAGDFFAKRHWPTQRLIVTGTGVGLMGTSVVMHFGVVVPSFAMVEFGRRNNEWITEHAANVLTDRFVKRRAMTWTVAGVGGAATAVGLVVMKPRSTSAVQPFVLPGGAGLHGRF
jgi:hypothetical protein